MNTKKNHINHVLTFEKKVRIILESVVRLLHSNEAGVHGLPLLAVPGLCNQLRPKLEDQAEDAVDDVHNWSRFLCQQTPGEMRERGESAKFRNMTRNFEMTFQMA